VVTNGIAGFVFALASAASADRCLPTHVDEPGNTGLPVSPVSEAPGLINIGGVPGGAVTTMGALPPGLTEKKVGGEPGGVTMIVLFAVVPECGFAVVVVVVVDRRPTAVFGGGVGRGR
jgi:hypothetical protein